MAEHRIENDGLDEGKDFRDATLAETQEPRVDVDRQTLERILSLPVDDAFGTDIDEAEAPVT